MRTSTAMRSPARVRRSTHRTERLPSTRFRKSATFLVVVSAMLLVAGCTSRSPPVSTGGDSPVTVERLTGSRLADIRRPVTWSFYPTRVVIENDSQPIPADVVQDLLGTVSTPKRIEAAWKFDEAKGALQLTDLYIDGAKSGQQINVSISPAGHVRMNLGSRQYNVFSGKVKGQLPPRIDALRVDESADGSSGAAISDTRKRQRFATLPADTSSQRKQVDIFGAFEPDGFSNVGDPANSSTGASS